MMGNRRDRGLLGILLGATLGLLLWACAPPEPVRIGYLGGLSGPATDLGEAGRDGALFAVEEANAAGGIGGRRIELRVFDDGQDEAQAVRAIETLAKEGVELVIGPMTSGMGAAVLPVAERLGVLLLSPTITASRFVGRDDNLLVVLPNVGVTTRLFAAYLHAQGVRRLAVAYDTRNLAYSSDWTEHLRAALQSLGSEVVVEVPFAGGDFQGYAEAVRTLMAGRPDALHFVFGAVDTVRLVQAVRNQGVALPCSASSWSATEHLVQLGGRSVDGLAVSQLFIRDDTQPRFRAFRAAFLARFNQEPGYAAVAAYDATRASLEAYARRPREGALKKALLDIGTFDGVQQRWSFDQHGDATRGVSIAVVHEGRFVPVEKGVR